MRKLCYQFCIELTNRKWSSKLITRFTTSKLSRFMIPSFVKFYRINLNEAEKPYNEYMTLHEFFTRHLKKETRPIDNNSYSVVSPVDAIIESMGTISPSTEMVVKGKSYSLVEMLGSSKKADQYSGGTYIVFYLGPKDYHRIHSPVSGKLVGRWGMGNRSYPVNRLGLLYGKAPLAKNYRSISEIEHTNGKIAVVKIGAMWINSIHYTGNEPVLQKGEEIAYFSFGSTVVLLFERGSFEPKKNIAIPHSVKMGQSIGVVMPKNK